MVHTDRFDGSLVPGLATSWEANEDGTQWTFHLRDDVEFNRGWGAFTAHDVPHSLILNTREDAIATDTGLFRQLFGATQEEQLSNVVALDDHTVQFSLLEPNSIVDFFASAQQGNLFIYSKEQYDADGIESYEVQPAGVGPWQFESRALDVNLLYSRVADHWRRSPFFEEMEYILIPEETTRLAQLNTGQVQIGEVSRELHADAEAAGMQVIQSQLPSIQVAFIIGGVYNPNEAGPCADGSAGCFWRPTSPTWTPGSGRPLIAPSTATKSTDNSSTASASPTRFGDTIQPSPAWNSRWTEEFDEKYGFDPDRARQLLQEAGQEGYKLKLLLTELPGVPEMIPMGEAAYTYLSNIGIEVESEAIEWSSYRADYYRPGKTHSTLAASRGTYRPAEITLRFYNRSGDAGFWRTSVDPMTDALYDKATQSVDPVVKADALRQLGDLKFDSLLGGSNRLAARPIGGRPLRHRRIRLARQHQCQLHSH